MMIETSNSQEYQEPEDQLNTAFKLIISTFENHSRAFTSEIARLTDELSKANLTIFEKEQKCQMLTQDKINYKEQVSSLLIQNTQLNQSNQELQAENQKLKTIRNTIMATIEKTDQQEPLSPMTYSPKTLSPSIKYNKPQIISPRHTSNNISKQNTFDTFNIDNVNPTATAIATAADSRMHTKNKSYTTTTSSNIYNPSQPRLSRNNSNKKMPNSTTTSSNGITSKTVIHSPSNEYINNVENKEGRNSTFFKNCRKELDPNEYQVMIDIVRAFNMKELSKSDTFMKITSILQRKYPFLYKEFTNLFISTH